MTHLRNFQQVLKDRIFIAWQDPAKRKLMPVLPTGGGKTVVVSDCAITLNEPGAFIAHRAELTAQMSLAIARNGIRHRIIGPEKLQKIIMQIHLRELDNNYINPHSKWAVAGVDTLAKVSPSDPIFTQSRFWAIDEGHHVLRHNKWGKTAAKFHRDCFALMPTATPIRADGMGLGAHADGLVDEMIIGPGMRDLINQGYLCDYRLICPRNDLDMSKVHHSADGDFNQIEMRDAVKNSQVIGNVVRDYLKFAKDMLGVTFAADIEQAGDISRRFNAAGVRAEVVTGNTPADVRASILRRFAQREIMMLVNVDLFGEGFDLPAVEVVIMARPTESYSLYAQQFGRALRIMVESRLNSTWHTFTDAERLLYIAGSRKPNSLIIDHVGNWKRHNLPDKPRIYTLDRREKRAPTIDEDILPLRNCAECSRPYEKSYKTCPHCGYEHIPSSRDSPAEVDGDMNEISPAMLAQLRGEIAKIDNPMVAPRGFNDIIVRSLQNKHYAKQQAQFELRQAMMIWGGHQTALGRQIDEAQRRFYHLFNIDVLSAQALNAKDAEELKARILLKLSVDGIVNNRRQ